MNKPTITDSPEAVAAGSSPATGSASPAKADDANGPWVTGGEDDYEEESSCHYCGGEGWMKDHPWNLVERILDETVEVQQCFTAIGAHTVNLTRTPEETADECADVANFCMMVADRVTAQESANKDSATPVA